MDVEDDFVEESVQFREHRNMSPLSGNLLKLLRKRNLHTVFPNTDIALHHFLTIPVTNANWRANVLRAIPYEEHTMQKDRQPSHHHEV